ncbi:MAG: type II toxin-antitoxin system MqsA family antitoxin [Clostridia bacterium]|nr:type II toxin-antitoxin system MqsA family antitoxin [Clostridia bacterium]
MKCLLCKEDAMENDKCAYFAQLPDCYVIIENVPCRKCAQCGEVVYSASVMEKIDEILKKVQQIASKILIMDFDRAA